MASLQLGVVDLGAESGRVLLASYDGRRLELQEVHRFPNQPVRVHGHLHWNLLGLWQEIVAGLRGARARAGTLHSVGVDTWAVDYALLDHQNYLLGLPFHYRDQRTTGMMEQVFAHIPREEVYAQTGIQFMPINTLYQLQAHIQQQPELFDCARRLVMIPDLLNGWLSGEFVGEYTNATTTQCWSVPEGRWASKLLGTLGLPTRQLPPIVAPGTSLGLLVPELQSELGRGVRVIAPATHDTGSAIAALPATGDADWAYISSGTWSLVGLELGAPAFKQGSASNFTNEGGIFGTVRFLRNVTGLWLVQECRKAWEREGFSYGYDELFALAEQAPAFRTLLNPDEPDFLAPDEMPARIAGYLERVQQPPAPDHAALIRAILESLTLRYRQILELAARITGRQLSCMHIVGGGSQNARLNQWLADATGLRVVAGPVEASALGNALLQLVGLGELGSLAEVRTLATRSTTTQVYTADPSHRASWDEAYTRFQQLARLEG